VVLERGEKNIMYCIWSIVLEERQRLEMFRLHFVALNMTALWDGALRAWSPDC